MTKVTKDKVKNGQFIDIDIDLSHKGKNYSSYRFMGARSVTEKRKREMRSTTQVPNANKIYVVRDFCGFKSEDEFKMEKVNKRGVWSIFIPGLKEGTKYEYFIINRNSSNGVYKIDPYAIFSGLRPNTTSIITDECKFRWSDKRWTNKRGKTDTLKPPVNIYGVYLGSWRTEEGEFLIYKELYDELPRYLTEMGCTHIKFMPLIEHPLDAFWGYQGTGHYSIASRYGDPEGLKELINVLHKNNIEIILDWVPGHLCKGEHGLYHSDGSPTYEYQEGWKTENKGWGTTSFDLDRPRVKSFLISNALFQIREFHIDGLRVDTISSMLYLNYGRNDGKWRSNRFGGDGCLEGVEFIKELNKAMFDEFKNVLMVAEESTSWAGVCKPIGDGGLGFNFRWNMGWMNDTLRHVEIDPIYRKHHHNNMNFSMMYNYSENFILPMSHDEVVHGKKSLIDKVWGDYRSEFAGLRLYLTYVMGYPRKKLTFMRYEFAQFIKWREYEQLKWKLIKNFEMHKVTQDYCKTLNRSYKEHNALWELDYDTNGFEWIDADSTSQSIFTFIRKGNKTKDALIFVCSFAPVVYHDFRIGVPYNAEYSEVFNSDRREFGGSNQLGEDVILSEKVEYHNKPCSIALEVPPIIVSILSTKELAKSSERSAIEGKEIIEG